MNGLLEFFTRVKGVEYLLAVGFLISFIVFWQWHHFKGRGLVVRVAPLAAVALVFAVAAAMVITSPAGSTKAQEFPSVDQAHYLANIYGPAKFAAHGMSPEIISCQTCHHYSPPDQPPQACSTCHREPFDGQATDKPGLKAAYHQRCADCHKTAFSGPQSCTNCHTEKPEAENVKAKSPSPVTAPDISHELLNRYANCFSCHVPEGPLPLPGNHKDYKANVVCLGCHKPSVATPGVTIGTVQKPATAAPGTSAPAGGAGLSPAPAAAPAAQPAAQPAAAPAPAPQPAGPKPTTHSIAGKENCTMCHQVGGSMKPMPADHSARSNATCVACHKAS